jgi:cytochrome c553
LVQAERPKERSAAARELADHDLAEIDAALSATPVQGARQSPAGLALLGRWQHGRQIAFRLAID